MMTLMTMMTMLVMMMMIKMSANDLHAFDSPNLPPLATVGTFAQGKCKNLNSTIYIMLLRKTLQLHCHDKSHDVRTIIDISLD